MITEEMKAERMAEDIRRIKATDQWPYVTYLPMKTQLWVSPWKSATLAKIDLYEDGSCRIIERGGVIAHHYDSLEEAVRTWSVD